MLAAVPTTSSPFCTIPSSTGVGVGLTIFWLHPNKTANATIKTMATLALLMLLLLRFYWKSFNLRRLWHSQAGVSQPAIMLRHPLVRVNTVKNPDPKDKALGHPLRGLEGSFPSGGSLLE
jgi:hypothetical protein